IRAEDAETGSGKLAQSGFLGNIFKTNRLLRGTHGPAPVAVELRDRAGEGRWATKVARAGRIGAGAGRRVLDIINNHQIQPTVAIIIEERGRRAPMRIIDTGFLRDVG